jgi:hypothetical protein
MSQESYIHRFVEEQGLGEVSSTVLPITLSNVYAIMKNTPISSVDGTKYKHIVGKVMFTIVGIHPNIAYITGFLGKYIATPNLLHSKAYKALIYYLHRTEQLSLVYRKTERPFLLTDYADSDWAGSED